MSNTNNSNTNNSATPTNGNGRDIFGVRHTSRGFSIGDVLIESAAMGEAGLSTKTITDRTHASKLGADYEKINGKKVAAVNGQAAIEEGLRFGARLRSDLLGCFRKRRCATREADRQERRCGEQEREPGVDSSKGHGPTMSAPR